MGILRNTEEKRKRVKYIIHYIEIRVREREIEREGEREMEREPWYRSREREENAGGTEVCGCV